MTGADEAVATGPIVTWIYFFYASSTDYCVDLVMVYRKRRAMGANRIYWLLPLTGSEWPENGKSHPIADITITFDSCRYIMVADGSFRASSSVVAPLCTHLEGQCVIRRTDQTTRYEFSRRHTLEIEKTSRCQNWILSSFGSGASSSSGVFYSAGAAYSCSRRIDTRLPPKKS